MASKSALVAAGLTGVAAVTVGTLALVQPKPESSPMATPTALPSAVSGNQDAAQPPTVSVSPSPSLGTVSPSPTASDNNQPVMGSDVPTDTNGSQSVDPSSATPTRQVESCKVTMAKVSDPNPPSNLRSQPSTASGSTIVSQLKNGTFLTVVEEKDDWFRISTPAKGWIAKSVVQSGCNEKTERVTFAQGSIRATLGDQFIGTGSHIYRVQLSQGQTLTITRQKGPLPAVRDPKGKFLVGMDDRQASWTQKLALSGDYQIVLDSNYKGYQYRFQVEVQ
ncbi:SH3 domain-containing protein [Alkalinema sp. FACHB-956]|uniref:SH3 domain-containing protein n=1 Tax=Alkalinema sp. FACHB-956 TaxID=2692768 RepID=UPI001689963D|nr:SH3 domain-containing protein [Alkalinema sp. FACHB-956]MBD2325554.1 SH3 domain-containing protein [Alkalinema sp. FACHB-956]